MTRAAKTSIVAVSPAPAKSLGDVGSSAAGLPPSVALPDHPPSWNHENPSVIAQEAYALYQRRRAQGEQLVPSQYCQEFPSSCRYALRRLLSVHCALVDDHPSWLEELQQGLLDDEPPWPSIGDDWLGYQIDEQIGQGGLARVYLASELSAGQRRVVLKITPFETGEGHLQSNLSHDSIVPVFTVRRDEVSGLTAIVMPYWGRATLQEVRDRVAAAPSRDSLPPEMIHQIARQHCGARLPTVPGRRTSAGRPTSFRQALARLGAQLAEALAYTHDQGVLHRDLKPTNVLLTPDGRPLLMDFNLSASFEHAEVLLGGTIPYMPPELLRAILGENSGTDGESELAQDCPSEVAGHEVPTVRGFRTTRDDGRPNRSTPGRAAADPRSDLFSLGVIFYELLCGRLPYGEPDLRWPLKRQARWMLDQQQTLSLSAATDWTELEPAWRDILERCLAPAPADRFFDARQLLEALHQLDPPAPEPTVASTASRLSFLATRVRWPAVVLAAATLLLTASPTHVLDQPTFRALPAVARYRPDPPLVFPVRDFLKRPLRTSRPKTRDEALALRNLDAIMSSVRDHPSQRDELAKSIDQLLHLLPHSGEYRADVLACVAYCRSRMEEHRLAVEDYRTALDSSLPLHYADRSRTHNNYSYSLQRMGDNANARNCAEFAIQGAAGDEENLAAAHLNRAICDIARLEREIRKARETLTPATFADVIEDIEFARRRRAGTATFHYLALRVYSAALSVVPSSQWRDQASQDLNDALKHGLDPKLLNQSSPTVRDIVKSLAHNE